jgi:hypothetical protein
MQKTKTQEKEIVMNRMTSMFGLMALLGATSVFAQSTPVRATIPFDFRVGERVMPAGSYTLTQSSAALFLRKEGDTRASIVTLTNPTYHSGAANNAGLEFNRYGDVYFLSKFWSDSSYGRELVKTGQERELAKRTKSVETAGIALKAK